jgi:signal transduction histidine kinase
MTLPMPHLPTLLIVDDIKENVYLLKEFVKKFNINLIQAYSGFEALEKTKGIDLALALIDVQMPIMNGYELAVKLNEERPRENVPIIFITAHFSNIDETLKGYNSGAVDYIFKPVNNVVLLSKINIFLDLFNQKQIIIRDSIIIKKSEEKLKNSLEQLRQLSNHIDKVREEERVTISRNLHDDLGQALTAVKIDLGIIKNQINDESVVLKIDKISGLVSENIKTVQRITAELRPQIIDDLGLEAAIEWHTKEFADRTGIEISLQLDYDMSISPNTSLILFRIMQESLTNIARHSKASHVTIGLNIKNKIIYFNISDNGIGITEKQINAKKSFGILGMKERASAFGGSLNICNGDDHGTVIKLILPINNKY